MATFNGREYPHQDIAERQREVFVSATALRMMQEHHGNPYFSFKNREEEKEWCNKAEKLVPPVLEK